MDEGIDLQYFVFMISQYHSKHSNRSDEESNRRILVKEQELLKILSETGYVSPQKTLRVAVLGCADKRFVKLLKLIFEKVFQKTIDLVTFDITIEHLMGEEQVIQHDVTMPLPGAPFDITFGHVLLKFIEIGKQWDVLMNAYHALRSPGLAIFIFDREDAESAGEIQADGYYTVPIEKYKEMLRNETIRFEDIRWELHVPDLQIPIRGLRGGALVLEKQH